MERRSDIRDCHCRLRAVRLHPTRNDLKQSNNRAH